MAISMSSIRSRKMLSMESNIYVKQKRSTIVERFCFSYIWFQFFLYGLGVNCHFFAKKSPY